MRIKKFSFASVNSKAYWWYKEIYDCNKKFLLIKDMEKKPFVYRFCESSDSYFKSLFLNEISFYNDFRKEFFIRGFGL